MDEFNGPNADFDKYQRDAISTAIYPEVGSNLYYPVLGLCGETGEIAEKIKKIMRDHGGTVWPNKQSELKKELGDVLWYLAVVSYELGLSLSEIAEGNIEKLTSRKDRGKLQGSGDDR